MDENTEVPMETDVSSTTQDPPGPQEAATSSNNMEVTVEVAETTVEVEEVNENDQDQSIDSNTPETELQVSKTLTKTPENSPPSKPTSLPTPTLTSDTPSTVDTTLEITLQKEIPTPDKNSPTPQKNTIIPQKVTLTPIKVQTINPQKINTISQKDIIQSQSNVVLQKVTVVKDSTTEPKSEGKSITEADTVVSKSPTKDITTNIDSHPSQADTEKITEELPANIDSTKSPDESTVEEHPKLDALVTEQEPQPNIPINKDAEELTNDSQTSIDTSTTDSTEKDPNKSISRELRSLINSAKESKIISECTQLTSKTRKSRAQNESLNSTLNTSTDAKKIQTRRGSGNSQMSNSSEVSEREQKRTTRSKNPEFASKQKQFLSNVTSKLQKEDTDGSQAGSDDESSQIKPEIPKDEKKDEPSQKFPKLKTDPYCWRCHYLVEDVNEKKHAPTICSICPRAYHFKCLSGVERSSLETEPSKKWVCPECMNVMTAEGSDTRSPGMRKINVGMLCELLNYALKRMMDTNGVEPFLSPVDRTVFPSYDKYVVRPMDLGLMQENIARGEYGSTEAFIADVQWILHNSIIFNTLQSKLTAVARTLVRSARQEMGEIEACPECYAAAHARRPTWFTDVCSTPHILLWAKLKGFPYWPAKGMTVNTAGMVDVRFFGAHDRAWVPARDCYLYSEKDPNNFRTKRQDLLDSMQEAEQHIRNISRKFGKFVYPQFRVQFEPSKISEQLVAMIPGYVEEFPRAVVKDKSSTSNQSPSALNKRRSASKSSKDPEGETSDGEDGPASKKKIVEVVDPKKSDKSSESIKSELDTAKSKDTESTRKRRRSVLEEATIMTIMDTPAEKKRRLSGDAADSSPSILAKVEESKDPPKTPKLTKEDKPKTPKPRGSSTPKIVLKTVPVLKKNPEVEIQKAAAMRKEKSSSSDKEKTDEKNKSINKPKSKAGTPQRAVDTKKEIVSEKVTPKAKESATKENDSSSSNSARSTPTRTPAPRSVKEKVNYDDDASPPATSKKTIKTPVVVPNKTHSMPTISNVRSLSQPLAGTSKSPGSIAKSPKVRVLGKSSVTSNSSPTNKAQKQTEPTKNIVGTVGVRAFARMTSPSRDTSNQVEVEVKAEPIEIEDADRQSQKIEMLHSFRLRPVNPTSLRDVRLVKPQVQNNSQNKTPEVRTKARKTFPQPKKPDEGLNGKNTMVYIPIQPPMTQAPLRPQCSANGPMPMPPTLRASAPVVSGPVNPSPAMPPLITVTPSSMAGGTLAGPAGAGVVRAGPAALQTVPLITSVNGQWTFSLQPVLSVGGNAEQNVTQPMMNGLGGAPGMMPLPPGTTSPVCLPAGDPAALSPATNKQADSTLHGEPPKLLQKPSPQNPQEQRPDSVAVPSEAGPVNALLNQHANKLADVFRSLLEESLDKCAQPAAQVTLLKAELEKLRWTHKTQMAEIMHNHELQVNEMRTSFVKEKSRVLLESAKTMSAELEAALLNAKSKQWCANCRNEAQFYCCWNTSYCDYPCQRAHWAQHYATCTQQRTVGPDGCDPSCADNRTLSSEERLQPPELPANPKVSSSNTMTVGGKVIPPRVINNTRPNAAAAATGKSIMVTMMDDAGVNSKMKCVGTYKHPQVSKPNQFILNKQLKANEEASKKMVTSGGYLIIGGDATTNTSNSSIVIN